MGIFVSSRRAKSTSVRQFLAFATAAFLAISSIAVMDTPAQAVTQTYSYTGGPQIYVVPENITSITVTLNGAQGGTPSGGGTGGKGARVSASIAVTPGEVLMVMVGGDGTSNGGWNGGGLGAGTGGGATDIRRPTGAFNTVSSCAYTLTCGLAERLVVAGGGGGGGWANGVPANANGGDAGQTGLAGTASNTGAGDAAAGGGASPSAGGSAGSGTFTSPGQGAAAGGTGFGAASAWVAQATGGGGGGGYFGGGSGGVSQDPSAAQADGAAGGGGGSSWASAPGVSGASFSTGLNSGDGSLIIDPPSAIPSAAFGFTGAPQFYTVPPNTSEVFVRLYGAGAGAQGDIVFGRLPVTSGQTLQLNVGGRGYGDATFYPGRVDGEGGWNGGGAGYLGPGWGGGTGGGGATDIRVCAAPNTTPCALNDRVVVAGGGGGGSYGAWGLSGGRGGAGATGFGADGNAGDFGLGATLSAGGGVTGTGIATAGVLGVGGNAGQPFYGAGGGGGGLYGGGGGNGSGGGGGSSCAAVSGPCTSVTNVLGASNSSFGNTQGNGGSWNDGMAVITAMPQATTGLVTNVTSTTASVSGSINPKFLASTPKLFLGTNQSTIESCSSVSAPCTASNTVLRTANLATTLAGTSTHVVSGSITGLTANTTYYYRVCAQSVAGYSCGATNTFSTQLSITNTALANGTVGQVYSDNLVASGGSGSYTAWALVNATSLPAGLALNTQTGSISGTPTSAGTRSVDVEVTDSLSATVIKTLSIVVASAPAPSQGGSSGGSMPSSPTVGSISPRAATTVGGSVVTVTGTNLAGSTVTIGGVSVVALSNSASSLSFRVPAGLTGTVSLMISNSTGVLNLVNALTITAPVAEPTDQQPRTSKVVIFDNFAPGSSQLTAKHLAKLRVTAKASAGFKTMVCTGFTMGPTVLRSDRALALARATSVCNALRRLAPALLVERATGVTETGVGGKVRRVEVFFKD